jgi:hypothetical protein
MGKMTEVINSQAKKIIHTVKETAALANEIANN